MSDDKFIRLKAGRVNNLKNIDLNIARNQLIVITGLSGSGKSSLAFDTLYAEGQRRYVESLSAYARQFLGRMSKPECDYIKGLPPAIAIQQKTITHNPRSTVGTATEIYDYLTLLFARIGKTYSPISGSCVKKHHIDDIVQQLSQLAVGTKIAIGIQLLQTEGQEITEVLQSLSQKGFSRISINGSFYRIEELMERPSLLADGTARLVIDRMTIDREAETLSRLTDSIETALFESNGEVCIEVFEESGKRDIHFSNRFEADGIQFIEPNNLMFSFNSPTGACSRCQGFGNILGIDENLVIANPSLSVYEDAVTCWRGDKMSQWKTDFLEQSSLFGFPIHRPYSQLTTQEKELLWQGNDRVAGIDKFFEMVEQNQYKIQYRVMLARYKGRTVCPTCHGGRLQKEALYVKIGGRTIVDLSSMSLWDFYQFFQQLSLSPTDQLIAKRLLEEIKQRAQFLIEVGLGYLSLNRPANTLSGGESQRINLATSLGSSLVGSLYILDEPSIGLHSRDTTRLIAILRKLQQLGNTVIVVEHDEEMMRAADHIIDIGPDAGRLGGEVVFDGTIEEISTASSRSYTARYLTHQERIELPTSTRKWHNYIEIKGARANNLKGVDVKFPLEIMTVITGVSGSGKSTLVREILYQNIKRRLSGDSSLVGRCESITGDLSRIREIELVDQNPIGRSSRSNPVTYLKAYDEIRKLFADQPLAKQMGFGPSYFSFNTEGGRCEECEGDGIVTVSMQFMADVELVCESCGGKRFKTDILDVLYREKSIYDILEMTVNQAIEFFVTSKSTTERKIVKKLMPLQQVGLGYIKLGQSSSTLSGGESQRVKLAYFLSLERTEPTIYLFDEPTTGLHFHDIKTLLKAFDALVERGHTLYVIEHNMEVIKCADYIIDLGPEGGDQGGYLVACGTPKEISQCPNSHTGAYLASLLAQ